MSDAAVAGPVGLAEFGQLDHTLAGVLDEADALQPGQARGIIERQAGQVATELDSQAGAGVLGGGDDLLAEAIEEGLCGSIQGLEPGGRLGQALQDLDGAILADALAVLEEIAMLATGDGVLAFVLAEGLCDFESGHGVKWVGLSVPCKIIIQQTDHMCQYLSAISQSVILYLTCRDLSSIIKEHTENPMFEATTDFFAAALNYELSDTRMLDVVLFLTHPDEVGKTAQALDLFGQLTTTQRNAVVQVLAERDSDPDGWASLWDEFEGEAFG